jgi:hypothetical protein
VICLSAAELNALRGLPHICFVLYLAIRGAMDGSTRIAGEVTRISWWQFREACHVEAISGRHSTRTGTPTLEQIRSSARALQRAGLVLLASDARAGELKFKCPMAPLGQARPKKEQQGEQQGYTPHKRGEEQQGEQHTSIKALSIQNHQSSKSKGDVVSDAATPDDDDSPLLFNGALNSADQRRVRDLLSREKITLKWAQLYVDELHGWVRQAEKTGTPILNVVGYAKTIIRSSKTPGWEPRYAAQVAAERLPSATPAVPLAMTPDTPRASQWQGLPANIAKAAKVAGR